MPLAPAVPVAAVGGTADVIAGPSPSQRTAEQPRQNSVDTRADLEGLFAARDADFQRHAAGEGEDAATQPMFLGTEPAKL